MSTVWVSSTEPPIKIGVLQSNHLEENEAAQAILLDKLRREFHPRSVSLTYLDWKQMEKSVRSKEFNLVLVNSPFFATIERAPSVRPLIGLVRDGAVDAEHMLAATLVVPKEKVTPNLIELKNKTLYRSEVAEEANLVFKGYLHDKGFKEENFFKRVIPVKGNLYDLLEKIHGDSDAVAILPACALEEISEGRPQLVKHFSVVEPKAGDGLNCLRTTSLYPGWVLASLSDDDLLMIRKATAAALNTPMAGHLQWSFPPNNFQGIRNVLIDTRTGPYAHMEDQSFKDFLYAHRYWVWGFVSVLFLIFVHGILVELQVRRKTKSIAKLMEEKVRFSKEMSATRERLQDLEKFQSLNQLSALLAHELKQPLGAIRNYSRGLVKRARKNNQLDLESCCSVLEVIVAQSDKAAQIVEQVRQYAKNSSAERQVVQLNSLLSSTVLTFKNSYEYSGKLTVSISSEPIQVEVNLFEIELVIINLLKNAAEAIAVTSSPHISVSLKTENKFAVLVVRDNGKIVSKEDIKRFFKPLFTTKKQGMGLGLTICTYIAEGLGGRLDAEPNPHGGASFILTLPLFIDQQEGTNDRQ